MNNIRRAEIYGANPTAAQRRRLRKRERQGGAAIPRRLMRKAKLDVLIADAQMREAIRRAFRELRGR
jgi:hypothetical protein